jgi:hypothetical protein
LSLRRYSPYLSSGEYLGGTGTKVGVPHFLHVGSREYSWHVGHFLNEVFIFNLSLGKMMPKVEELVLGLLRIPMECSLSTAALDLLDHGIGDLAQILFRHLVVRS